MNELNKTIVYPKVVIYNNLLKEKDDIVLMLKKAESYTEKHHYLEPWKEWKPMGLINNIDGPGKYGYAQEEPGEKRDQAYLLEKIYDAFFTSTNDFFEIYKESEGWPSFIKHWDKSKHPWSKSGISFLKYNKTNYNFNTETKKYGLAMDYHTDTHEFDIESPGNKFIITATMYLNDDYEGGEISYLDESTGSVTNYKPKAGDVTVFPSGAPYYHGVFPVLSGERYLLRMFWLYSFDGTQEWHENEKKYGPELWQEMEKERIKKAFDSGEYHRFVVYPGEKYSLSEQRSKPFFAKDKPSIIE